MIRARGRARRWLGPGLALAVAAGSTSCRRKHVPIAAGNVPDFGYPACGARPPGADAALPLDPGDVVASGHVRSGPYSVERAVNERFELRRTACGYTLRSRQEWPLAVSDLEVRYDDALRPIWAWKRMTIPGSKRDDGNADLRRYELRTGDVFIVHRDDQARTTFEKLLPGGRMPLVAGATVGAVIAPGRGMLTPWLWRARLPVGGRDVERVLDLREAVESLETAALRRESDRFEPSLGKVVRVYTFYGRETVFADERDVVIGDLSGLRPSESLSSPEPPALPTYGAPAPQIAF